MQRRLLDLNSAEMLSLNKDDLLSAIKNLKGGL